MNPGYLDIARVFKEAGFMRDYDVYFTDRDGFSNHKILSAHSEGEVMEYMKRAGYNGIIMVFPR